MKFSRVKRSLDGSRLAHPFNLIFIPDRDGVKAILFRLAKHYDVQLKISDKGVTGGWSAPKSGKIYIHTNLLDSPVYHGEQLSNILSIFFHEVAHCLNYRNKKYEAFHSFDNRGIRCNSLETIKKVIRTAIKAEKYTDSVGRRLMKKHVPFETFVSFYETEKGQKLLKENWLSFWVDVKNELEGKF